MRSEDARPSDQASFKAMAGLVEQESEVDEAWLEDVLATLETHAEDEDEEPAADEEAAGPGRKDSATPTEGAGTLVQGPVAIRRSEGQWFADPEEFQEWWQLGVHVTPPGVPPPRQLLSKAEVVERLKMARNAKGTALPSPENIAKVLAFDPRFQGRIALDTESGRILLRHQVPIARDKLYAFQCPATDIAMEGLDMDRFASNLIGLLESPRSEGGYEMGRVARATVIDATRNVASASPVHVLQDWIRSCEWDHQPRLETAFMELFGEPDSIYIRTISRLFFVALVARIMEPGQKFDYMLILRGPQSMGKSGFCEHLLTQRFHGVTTLDVMRRDKELIEAVRGKGIVEVAELVGMTPQLNETIKSRISASVLTARMAYAADSADHPCQHVYVGTTNNDEFLYDRTGNRRYLVVKVSREVDRHFIALMRNVWIAEAYREYRALRARQPTGDLPLYLERGSAAHVEQEARNSEARVWGAADDYADILTGNLDRPVRLSVLRRDGPEFDSEDVNGRADPWVIPTLVSLAMAKRIIKRHNEDVEPRLSHHAVGTALKMTGAWRLMGREDLPPGGVKKLADGTTCRRLWVRIGLTEDEMRSGYRMVPAPGVR